MINWLEDNWRDLTESYAHKALTISLWKSIKSQYTSKNRHYHNLSHVYNMFLQLETVKDEIKDLDSLKFAIWFHDIIYKSTNKDNEEQSANFAQQTLKSMNFDNFKIKKVTKLIISTKKHTLLLNENYDNAYLLDLDLSILGSDWKTYSNYVNNIRKEYIIYPNILYKPGRKKVIKNFLERESLYFTNVFKTKFEEQARHNLTKEIKML
ncbi:HD domain-containing protein [Winogradskyella endarachnes]|nr:hypothetical protein [Winogradskyella endarachnes]